MKATFPKCKYCGTELIILELYFTSMRAECPKCNIIRNYKITKVPYKKTGK